MNSELNKELHPQPHEEPHPQPPPRNGEGATIDDKLILLLAMTTVALFTRRGGWGWGFLYWDEKDVPSSVGSDISHNPLHPFKIRCQIRSPMPYKPRNLQPEFCYHVTTRCNNREFKLIHRECREVFIYALTKAINKFHFKLYGLCLMSNHVHYLIEPKTPESLPKIMHWLNWYTAMCFNRMLNRSGHFWEKRYHSSGFESNDYPRTLNTLRYIHANPKAAGMQQGFFYDFSNYGIHDRLTDDGLTEWHPAFLSLGKTSEECATRYRGFCKKYKPQSKPEKRFTNFAHFFI